jgi:hypothetical protein
MDHAKRSFFKATNAISGKFLDSANENTVIHLLKFKCLPILLYGLEACVVTEA